MKRVSTETGKKNVKDLKMLVSAYTPE